MASSRKKSRLNTQNQNDEASLRMRLAMTEWQQDTEEVIERDLYVLQHQMWTDCIFLVGKDKKRFECHRLHLAKTSPVFAAQLYGDMFQLGEEIEVPDVTPKAFEAMLQYIYKGTFSPPSSYEAGLDLMYVVKKYLLPRKLLLLCRIWLSFNIRDNFLWLAYEGGKFLDEPHLVNITWKLIQRSARLILEFPNTISLPTLTDLLSEDSLNCTEIQLYERTVDWAKHQLEHTEQEVSDVNVRRVLTPVMKLIRFCVMSAEEFAKGPGDSEILSESEKLQILLRIGGNENRGLSEDISASKIPRNNVHKHSTNENISVSVQNSKSVDVVNSVKDTVSSCYRLVNVGHCVHGIVVPSQYKAEATEEESYEENLTVCVASRDFKILFVHNFKEKVKFNSVITIPCQIVFTNECSMLAQVVFHKSVAYSSTRNKAQEKNLLAYMRETNKKHWPSQFGSIPFMCHVGPLVTQ